MAAVFILMLGISAFEVIFCHFSLWWIIAMISRVLFLTRRIGVVFRIKRLIILECVAFGCGLLWNMIVHKNDMPWIQILVFFLCGVGSSLIMFIDDVLYVYTTEDDS